MTERFVRGPMLLAALALGGPVAAEEPPARVIEEVVVTAQKVEQSSQDVPISLTTVDGDFLKDVGATNLQDIAPYVPNLKFSSDTDPVLAQINIRGFGTNPLNAAFESSVGYVQDDFFYGRPSYVADSIFDLERVEVLRGPQGTLFGKNTVAGVFNTVSAGPTETFSGDVRLSGSHPKEIRAEAGVGGMLHDRIGFRLAGLHFDRSGELENTFLNRKDDQFEQHAGRLKLRLLPLDDVTVDLVAMTSTTDHTYWPTQLHRLDDDTRAFLDDFDPRVEGDGFDHQLSFNVPGFLDKESDALTGKAVWDFGALAGIEDVTATTIVGHTALGIDSVVDLDSSPADIGILPVVSDYDQQSVEVRLTGRSPAGLFGFGQSVDFVTGAYYFQSLFTQVAELVAGRDFAGYLTTDDASQLASGNPSNSTVVGSFGGLGDAGGLIGDGVIGDDRYRLDYRLDVGAFAWFGQMTWQLTDAIALTPGLRINHERKDADALGRGQCATKESGGACVMETALQANDYAERGLRRSELDFSPKVSLQYFLGVDLTFFTTWARGFKSGGFNASSFTGDDLVFEEERASTWELGAKGAFFDRALRFNLALFQTDFENLQVFAFNGAFFDVTNAASATSRGLELDFRWLTPLEFLDVNGALGLLDANYDSYPSAPAPISEGVNAVQDLSGRPVALAPDQTASLTPTVSLPLGDRFGLRTSFDVLYQGDQFTDTDLDPATFVPGQFLYSARTSLGTLDGTWALTLGGSNLADADVANQILDTVFFPGTYVVTQRAGRKVFLALTGRW